MSTSTSWSLCSAKYWSLFNFLIHTFTIDRCVWMGSRSLEEWRMVGGYKLRSREPTPGRAGSLVRAEASGLRENYCIWPLLSLPQCICLCTKTNTCLHTQEHIMLTHRDRQTQIQTINTLKKSQGSGKSWGWKRVLLVQTKWYRTLSFLILGRQCRNGVQKVLKRPQR